MSRPRGTSKFPEIAMLVARGYSVDRAARECGVPGRTAREWTKSVEFRTMVAEARSAALDSVVGCLTSAASVAVARLVKGLKDDGESGRRSAVDLLNHLMAIQSHQQLLSRIEALEAKLHEDHDPVPVVHARRSS